jgi:hypothetical protein
MSMLLLIASAPASLLAAPEFLNGRDVITVGDYPPTETNAETSAFVDVNVIVG